MPAPINFKAEEEENNKKKIIYDSKYLNIKIN